MTINGRVWLTRTWWHSPIEGSSAPLDALIHADGSTTTPGVREMACRVNNHSTAFATAAQNLQRTAQVSMCDETLRQIVLKEGRRVQADQRSGRLLPSFTAEDCRIDKTPISEPAKAHPTSSPTTTPATPIALSDEATSPESVAAEPVAAEPVASEPVTSAPQSSSATVSVRRMYCGVDGVMVPTITDKEKKLRRQRQVKMRHERAQNDPVLKARQKTLPRRKIGTDHAYKEFKLLAFYDESNQHKHLMLSRARRPEVGALLKQMAGPLKFGDCEEKIANVDGAVWIPEQIEAAGLDVDGLGLDFYHLSEHVHAAKRAVFGESSLVGAEWVSARLHDFKHSGYDTTVTSLSEWKSPMRGTRRKAATKLLNYVTDRRGMVQYPEFIAEGWQIGSGPTESGCRTSTRRLKVSGARWDMSNAESVAALVNLQDSHQWHQHWPNLKPVTT